MTSNEDACGRATDRDTGVKTDGMRSHARMVDDAPDGDRVIVQVNDVAKGFKLTDKSR